MKEAYVPLKVASNGLSSPLRTESAKVPEANDNPSSAIAASAAAITPKIPAASLVKAIRQRQHSKLEDLLSNAADLHGVDIRGDTPIMWASTCNDSTAVKMLLKAKADANIPNQYGNTPLAVAAYNGYSAIIPDLIVGGASVNQKGIDGRSPVWYAAEQRQEEAVMLLTQFGAKLSRRTKYFFKKECQLDADELLREYRAAAAIVQAQIRRMIAQKQLKTWHDSATKIQAVQRGHRVRVSQREMQQAATHIQRHIRGFKSRLECTRLLLEREQKLMENKEAGDEDEYDMM